MTGRGGMGRDDKPEENQGDGGQPRVLPGVFHRLIHGFDSRRCHEDRPDDSRAQAGNALRVGCRTASESADRRTGSAAA